MFFHPEHKTSIPVASRSQVFGEGSNNVAATSLASSPSTRAAYTERMRNVAIQKGDGWFTGVRRASQRFIRRSRLGHMSKTFKPEALPPLPDGLTVGMPVINNSGVPGGVEAGPSPSLNLGPDGTVTPMSRTKSGVMEIVDSPTKKPGKRESLWKLIGRERHKSQAVAESGKAVKDIDTSVVEDAEAEDSSYTTSLLHSYKDRESAAKRKGKQRATDSDDDADATDSLIGYERSRALSNADTVSVWEDYLDDEYLDNDAVARREYMVSEGTSLMEGTEDSSIIGHYQSRNGHSATDDLLARLSPPSSPTDWMTHPPTCNLFICKTTHSTTSPTQQTAEDHQTSINSFYHHPPSNSTNNTMSNRKSADSRPRPGDSSSRSYQHQEHQRRHAPGPSCSSFCTCNSCASAYNEKSREYSQNTPRSFRTQRGNGECSCCSRPVSFEPAMGGSSCPPGCSFQASHKTAGRSHEPGRSHEQNASFTQSRHTSSVARPSYEQHPSADTRHSVAGSSESHASSNTRPLLNFVRPTLPEASSEQHASTHTRHPAKPIGLRQLMDFSVATVYPSETPVYQIEAPNRGSPSLTRSQQGLNAAAASFELGTPAKRSVPPSTDYSHFAELNPHIHSLSDIHEEAPATHLTSGRFGPRNPSGKRGKSVRGSSFQTIVNDGKRVASATTDIPKGDTKQIRTYQSSQHTQQSKRSGHFFELVEPNVYLPIVDEERVEPNANLPSSRDIMERQLSPDFQQPIITLPPVIQSPKYMGWKEVVGPLGRIVLEETDVGPGEGSPVGSIYSSSSYSQGGSSEYTSALATASSAASLNRLSNDNSYASSKGSIGEDFQSYPMSYPNSVTDQTRTFNIIEPNKNPFMTERARQRLRTAQAEVELIKGFPPQTLGEMEFRKYTEQPRTEAISNDKVSDNEATRKADSHSDFSAGSAFPKKYNTPAMIWENEKEVDEERDVKFVSPWNGTPWSRKIPATASLEDLLLEDLQHNAAVSWVSDLVDED